MSIHRNAMNVPTYNSLFYEFVRCSTGFGPRTNVFFFFNLLIEFTRRQHIKALKYVISLNLKEAISETGLHHATERCFQVYKSQLTRYSGVIVSYNFLILSLSVIVKYDYLYSSDHVVTDQSTIYF